MQATPLLQTPLLSQKQSLRSSRKKLTEAERKEIHKANMLLGHLNKEQSLMAQFRLEQASAQYQHRK